MRTSKTVTEMKVNVEQALKWGSYRKLFASARQTSQPTFSCSKLTIETLEQGVKYVQS